MKHLSRKISLLVFFFSQDAVYFFYITIFYKQIDQIFIS